MITQTELIRREKIRESKLGDKNPMKRIELRIQMMGDKNIMRRPGMSEKMKMKMLIIMNKPEVRMKVKETTPVYFGKDSPHWLGGLSFEPYSFEFNSQLKKKIRERDNWKCQICYLAGKYVHHIDYNKKNNSENNLITLCNSCHGLTNGNRNVWKLTLSKYMRDYS